MLTTHIFQSQSVTRIMAQATTLTVQKWTLVIGPQGILDYKATVITEQLTQPTLLSKTTSASNLCYSCPQHPGLHSLEIFQFKFSPCQWKMRKLKAQKHSMNAEIVTWKIGGT